MEKSSYFLKKKQKKKPSLKYMSEWKYTLVYDLVLRDHVTSAERI